MGDEMEEEMTTSDFGCFEKTCSEQLISLVKNMEWCQRTVCDFTNTTTLLKEIKATNLNIGTPPSSFQTSSTDFFPHFPAASTACREENQPTAAWMAQNLILQSS